MPALIIHHHPSNTPSARGRSRLRRRSLAGLALCAGLAVVTLGVVVLRGVTLPAPTGPHAVGRVTYRWTDSTRPEVMTDDPNDDRAVVVHVWYPAEVASGASTAAYLPDLAALRPDLAASPEVGLVKTWAISRVHGHALAEAPAAAAGAPYPLLLFLPGNRTNAGLYSVLIEDLASHGYIVAAIDHPYDVEAVLLPNGHTAAFAAGRWPAPVSGIIAGTDARSQVYRERVDVRAEDAVYALDQLAQLPAGTPLSGQIDLTRVGVFGHSVGGVAAPRACQLGARFEACLNIDGLTAGMPFYLTADGLGLTQPFLMLTKPNTLPTPTEADLARLGLTRTEWEAGAAAAQAEQLERLRAAHGGSYRVTVAGATHDSFTDTPRLRPAFLADRQASRQADITRAYVRAFFDHLVRDQRVERLSLPVGYEEVTVEEFSPR